jgi:hypothetical protein
MHFYKKLALLTKFTITRPTQKLTLFQGKCAGYLTISSGMYFLYGESKKNCLNFCNFEKSNHDTHHGRRRSLVTLQLPLAPSKCGGSLCQHYRAHSFGNFLTKTREISRTFALKKGKLLNCPSFGQVCHKCELFVKVCAISRF